MQCVWPVLQDERTKSPANKTKTETGELLNLIFTLIYLKPLISLPLPVTLPKKCLIQAQESGPYA